MMGIGFLVIVGLVVWAVVSQRHALGQAFATPTGTHYGGPTAHRDDAETIARERFARGEIDRDEYDRLIATLRGR